MTSKIGNIDSNSSNKLLKFFYPLIAFIAIIVPMYTVGVIVNDYFFELRFNIFDWHGHQMIFSYFYTFSFTFLLSQLPTSTNKKHLDSASITGLIILWTIDQVLMFTTIPYQFLIASSLCLSTFIVYQLFKTTKGTRGNRYIIFLFGVYSVLRAFFIYAIENNIHIFKEGIYEISVWILTFGFLKVIYSFVYSSTVSTKTTGPNLIQKSSSILATASFTIYLISSFTLPKTAQGILLLLSSIFFLFRCFSCINFKKTQGPIILIALFAYLLICLSLVTKGLSFFYPVLNLNRATLHLVLSGTLSLGMLLIMIRTTLIGSGNSLLFDKSIIAILTCLLLGATIRFIVPVINPVYFHKSLHHSMGIWTMAYLIFLIKYLGTLRRLKN
jgi:uncharacterized protein involved in response to NO